MKKYLVALQDKNCEAQLIINEHLRCFDSFEEADDYRNSLNVYLIESEGCHFYQMIKIRHDVLV